MQLRSLPLPLEWAVNPKTLGPDATQVTASASGMGGKP